MAKMIHPVLLEVEALLKECHVGRTRRSGPGGQHRNKVETAVVIEHEPTGIIAEASERRSQAQNKRNAIARLRMKLAIHHRCEVEEQEEEVKPSPSPLWNKRCKSGRVSVSVEHLEFPMILAEALDVITFYHQDLPKAAKSLGCSTSQLIKLLKKVPESLSLVNQKRKDAGQHAYK